MEARTGFCIASGLGIRSDGLTFPKDGERVGVEHPWPPSLGWVQRKMEGWYGIAAGQRPESGEALPQNVRVWVPVWSKGLPQVPKPGAVGVDAARHQGRRDRAIPRKESTFVLAPRSGRCPLRTGAHHYRQIRKPQGLQAGPRVGRGREKQATRPFISIFPEAVRAQGRAAVREEGGGFWRAEQNQSHLNCRGREGTGSEKLKVPKLPVETAGTPGSQGRA